MLYHETDLEIAEHYSDTYGYTDQTFGMCHLLGFCLSPKSLIPGVEQLFMMTKPNAYLTSAPLIGGAINRKQIRAGELGQGVKASWLDQAGNTEFRGLLETTVPFTAECIKVHYP